MNIQIQDLMNAALDHSKLTDWPYSESYYKAAICKYTPKTNRYTFTINYKRATKQQVIDYLNTLNQ